MKKENDKNNLEEECEYGEFISTFFNWKTLDKQKEIAENLEKITKKKNK